MAIMPIAQIAPMTPPTIVPTILVEVGDTVEAGEYDMVEVRESDVVVVLVFTPPWPEEKVIPSRTNGCASSAAVTVITSV